MDLKRPKFKKIRITNENIAEAIISFYNCDDKTNVDLLTIQLTKESYKKKNCTWFKICQLILNGLIQERSIVKYVPLCFCQFKAHREDIMSIIQTRTKKKGKLILQGTSVSQVQSQKIIKNDCSVDMSNKMEIETNVNTVDKELSPDSMEISAESSVSNTIETDKCPSAELSGCDDGCDHQTESRADIHQGDENLENDYCRNVPQDKHDFQNDAADSDECMDKTEENSSLPKTNIDPLDDSTGNGKKDIYSQSSQKVQSSKTPRETTSNKKSTVYSIRGPSFKLPPSFWEQNLTKDNKLKANYWTDNFNKVFGTHYKICVLIIKDGKVTYSVKKKEYTFNAYGKCQHSSCTKFRFQCQVRKNIHELDEVNVFQTSVIDHSANEVHYRPCKGQNRREMAAKLRSSSAAKIKLELLNKSDDNKLDNGNLNEVLDSQRLHKIHSEDRAANDLDKDPDKFMKLLHEKFEQKWQGSEFNNFIREYSFKPYHTILFTEAQLKVLLSNDKGKTFCNLDSTGKLVRKPDKNSKVVYYYTLLLPGTKMKNGTSVGPFPVAEYIANSHSVPDVQRFLNCVHYWALLVSKSQRQPLIDKIETDFSSTLLQAVSLSFNKLTLIDYVNLIYSNSDRLKSLTIIHVCSSHMFKTGIRKMKYLPAYYEKIAYKILTLMIHTTTKEKLFEIFEILWTLFAVPASKIERSDCLHNLSKFTPVDQDKIDELSDDDYDDLRNIKEMVTKNAAAWASTAKWSSSFYLVEANRRVSVIEAKYSSDDLKKVKPKGYRQNQDKEVDYLSNIIKKNKEKLSEGEIRVLTRRFAEYIRDYWMPVAPVWCAEQIIDIGLTRDSNASIENWHKIIKHYFYETESKIALPRFVQGQESVLEGRLKERKYDLTSERRKKNMKKKTNVQDRDDETAEEVWKPQSEYPKTGNRHFTIPKHVDNITQAVTVSDTENKSTTIEIDDESDSDLPDTASQSDNEDANVDSSLNVSDTDIQSRINAQSIISSELDYPEGFPNIENKVGPLTIRKGDFETLRDREWLSDYIIDGFGIILMESARERGVRVKVFEQHYATRLVENSLTDGYETRLRTENIADYQYWLFPLFEHSRKHWTLVIIDFSKKIIVYLDSKHKVIKPRYVDVLFHLIENWTDSVLDKKLSGWRVHCPIDTVEQTDGYNCGVHVCLWMYITCQSQALEFTENDLVYARKGISRILFNIKDFKSTDSGTNETRVNKCQLMENLIQGGKLRPKTPNFVVAKTPPVGYSSTLEYCADMFGLWQID